jgi:hypothetical protein
MNPIFDGLTQLLSNSSPAISIIISICALIISILSYFINKKEMDVLMTREDLKMKAREAVETLLLQMKH